MATENKTGNPAPTHLSPERLINPQELANLLGLARITVYKMAETGKIPMIKIGNSVRFRYSQVMAAIEGGAK